MAGRTPPPFLGAELPVRQRDRPEARIERRDSSSSVNSEIAEAVGAECPATTAPRRTLGFETGALGAEAAQLADQLLGLFGQLGLDEVAYRVARHPVNLARLSELEGRAELHVCDRARPVFMEAFLEAAKPRQAELKATGTPRLVALANDRLVESGPPMRAFARSYGVEPEDRLPPPAGSEAESKQASLRAAAGLLFAAHERLAEAGTSAEQGARTAELMALRAELGAEHPHPRWLPSRSKPGSVEARDEAATFRRESGQPAASARGLLRRRAVLALCDGEKLVEALVAPRNLSRKRSDLLGQLGHSSLGPCELLQQRLLARKGGV